MLKERFAYGLIFCTLISWAVFGQTNTQILPTNSTYYAYVGEAFSQDFTCPNCQFQFGTNSMAITGSLPAGLTFQALNRAGRISGVPTVANQNSTVTLTVDCDCSFPEASRTIQIYTDRRLVFLTDPVLAPVVGGVPFSRNIQVNLPSIWDNGTSNLPNSVTLTLPTNSTTAVLSGTFPVVTVPTTYSVQVYASYPGGSFSVQASGPAPAAISQTINRTFQITVTPPTPLTVAGTLPPGQVGVNYNGQLVTTGGTAPYSYSLFGSLPPGLQVSSNGFFSGIPTAIGTYEFSVIARDFNGRTSPQTTVRMVIGGPPMTITSTNLPVARVAQLYTAPLTVTGGIAPYFWSIVPPSTPPPGITISGSTLSGIANSVGLYRFDLLVTDNVGTTARATVSVAVNPPLLAITTLSLPNPTPTVRYDASLSGSGGIQPYTWTVASGSLPPGITLAPNGLLSGTTPTSGSYSFAIRLSDTANTSINYPGSSVTRDYVLGVGVLSIAPTTLPTSIVGQPFTPTLSATGGIPPYTWSVSQGTPQAGVTLSVDGVFSGIPTTAGISNFQVQVRDSVGQTATRDIALTTIAGLNISTATLNDGVVGIAYNQTLAAENGTAPYSYTVVTGTLPAGITLSSSGIFTGTPTAAGTSNVTIRVVDGGNLAANKAFTLLVRPALSIVTDTLPAGNVGAGYTAQIAAAGGFPGYTFAVSAGSLPPGLSMSTGGAITGTPTTAGNSTVTLRVTDVQNFTATRDYTINVTQVTLPSVAVTQINDTTAPGSQPTFGISLASAFPAPIDGTVTLAFVPESGPTDPDVKFANGTNTINFTIPTGSLNAVPTAGSFAFSSGTTAGTITLTVVARSNGQVLSPNPATTRTIRIARAAPTFTVRLNRTSSGFEVLVSGFSNTREITGGNLQVTPVPGTTLAASDFPLNVASAFQTWFSSAPSANFGTQFLLTIPFTVTDGTASSVSAVVVTLTNSAGSGSARGTF